MKAFFALLVFVATALPAMAAPTNTSGPWGISVTGFSNFSTASSSASTNGKTLVVDKATTVNSMTITGRTIKILHGGSINIAAGKTLKMPVPDAGKYQVFSGTGTVKLLAGGVILPEWFGPLTLDYSTDNSTIIQKAIDSCDTTDSYAACTVLVPPKCKYSVKTASRVLRGGTTYRCIQPHTSAADSEPGVGANWENYWVIDASEPSGIDWSSATAYSFSSVGISLKRNVTIEDNSNPSEKRVIMNHANTSGAVNESILSAAYHPGIILDVHNDYLSGALAAGQAISNRASLIFRANGVGKWQIANDLGATGNDSLTLFKLAGSRQMLHFTTDGSIRYGRRTSKQDFSNPVYPHTFAKTVAIEEDDGISPSLIFRTLNTTTDNVVHRKILTMASTDGSLMIANTANTPIIKITDSGAIQNLPTTNGPAGTFTVTNGTTSTVISNTSVTSNSIIILTATNSVAAGLSGVYVSAKSAGVGFTITHSSPGASGTFNYWMVN